MTTLVNDFSGIPAGDTITNSNSGGVSGDAFTETDASQDTTGGTCTRGDSHGRPAMAVTLGATFGPERRGWIVSGGTQYYRFYFDPADLTGTWSPLRGMDATSGAQRFRITVTTAGVVALLNNASATVWTSAACAAGTLWRVEVRIDGNTSSAGQVWIYDGESTTASQDSGLLAAQNFGGPVLSIWWGQTNSAGNLSAKVVGPVGWSDTAPLGPSVATPTVTHAWVAGVTSSSAVVSYGLANVTNAALVVSTNADLSSPTVGSAVAVDADGFLKLTATGLTADTTYHFGVQADGVLLADGRGQFDTAPTPGTPASFSVGGGSCQITDSNPDVFADAAANVGPYGRLAMFLHMGDVHYQDFVNPSAATLRAQWQSTLAQANMQTLLSTVPTEYIWDNHDSLPNRDAAGWANLGTVFRQVVPTVALPATGNGAWRTLRWGRVGFFILDTRADRVDDTLPDGASKTMLGAEQVQALKDWLADGVDALKIIVSSIMWRTGGTTNKRWGSYRTEFLDIKDFIVNNPDATLASRVGVMSGDRHAAAYSDGTHGDQDTYLPNWSAAPFNQGLELAAVGEIWDHYYPPSGSGNLQLWGRWDFADSGADITVTFRVFTADGVEQFTTATVFDVAVEGSGAASATVTAAAAGVAVRPGSGTASSTATVASSGVAVRIGGGVAAGLASTVPAGFAVRAGTGVASAVLAGDAAGVSVRVGVGDASVFASAAASALTIRSGPGVATATATAVAVGAAVGPAVQPGNLTVSGDPLRHAVTGDNPRMVVS